MQEARPLEVGIDEVALRKLVKSSTFKKFVHRVELENEVVELHQQLEREVGLHNSLQSALSHPSSTELPEPVVHDLPSNVQRLLTDIAMLEVAVLRLETQASALQWDIAHERTERETIEHTLNTPITVSVQPQAAKVAPASPPSTPRLSTSHRALSPARSPAPKSPVKASPKSPTLATLKELLHTPAPEPDQFEFYTPPKSPKQLKSPKPKSPRRSLRSLWSALDGQSQSTFSSMSKKVDTTKDRTLSPHRAKSQRDHQSPPDATCFPAGAGILPSNLHLSTSLSPYTPGEQPRTNTPVTPACQPDTAPRKLLNPARFLVSTKRLAFWNNFSSSTIDNSSSTDDAETLNNRAANPTPEAELLFVPESLDCSSILDEDFPDDVRMRKLRRSRGMKQRPDQSPLSPLDNARMSTSSFSFSSRSDFSSEPPRKSMKESPRQSFKVSPRPSIKSSPRPSTVEKDDIQYVQEMWTQLPSDANTVSEEMVRCMVDIYCHLAEPSSDLHCEQKCPLSPSSHHGRLSTSSSLSSHSDSSIPSGARSPEMDPGQYGDVMGCDTTPDPYKAMGKLPWAHIGPYSDSYEVPWLSVGKDQLEYVAHSLGRFRLLVERLVKVDPSVMSHEQKLAFWINLYNALLMHAFLAYGIPRSDLKFFTLMQKAAYCVGGHWFNAAAIECNLLKAKIMLHRPQFALIMALQNKKLTEEQSHYGIDQAEPKVNFALACGGHSSPMVRIYTPEHIHDELDSAFQDYLRATVGMTAKGRVLLPKLVYNYAREFVEDDFVLEWVCRFLPIAQVTVIYECIQQRHRKRLFNSAPFSVCPYSFAFRYLFPKGLSGAGDIDLSTKPKFCT
ncbi:hypothetical protein KC19_6G023300 [Ceratodon purpureus]|nr:hypothetical protein KC19_6G023300 [Ceratodon purpureus]